MGPTIPAKKYLIVTITTIKNTYHHRQRHHHRTHMKDFSGKSKPQPKVDMSEWFRALFFKALVARAGNMVDNMVARGTE